MELLFSYDIKKKSVFNAVEQELNIKDFTIINRDEERPWGGFFVIDEKQSQKFIDYFFADFTLSDLVIKNKLSPKILIVEPGKKLSWQFHHRRAERWKVIGGEAEIVTSENDEEGELKNYA